MPMLLPYSTQTACCPWHADSVLSLNLLKVLADQASGQGPLTSRSCKKRDSSAINDRVDDISAIDDRVRRPFGTQALHTRDQFQTVLL